MVDIAYKFFSSDDLRYPGSVPKPTDEQSALNKILQQTATWVYISLINIEWVIFKQNQKLA